MNLRTVKKILFLFVCPLLSTVFICKVSAQTVQYSSENVFINYPDDLQLVANIAGNHHMLCFKSEEDPEIFIFNQELKFQLRKRIPFKLSKGSEVRIIPFNNFYYLYIHPRLSEEYFLWKIDGNGNFSNLTASFQKLLQSLGIKLSFQLVANQEKLWMVYHTSLIDSQKSTVVIVQTDSLFNIEFTHKVIYDFKRDEEQLRQVALLFGKYLLILKTAKNGRLLELMKVNLASGYTITKTFQSSGYYYSQSSFNYNDADSTVTISSLLREPGTRFTPRRFIFLSRLNNVLIEQEPFAVLKSQFIKNINTNFLLVEGFSKWMRLREPAITSYPEFGMADPYNPTEIKRSWERYSSGLEDGIRFSLLNKNFDIISDSLVTNTKNSYTLVANEFASFGTGNKEYLLLGQLFSKRSRGILMIHANERHQLVYTDVRVNNRNNYLLSKFRLIPQQGILVPYTNRKEAGLIKISLE